MICHRPGCSGEIQDGYCNECGMAPALTATSGTEVLGSPRATSTTSTTSTSRPAATGTFASRRSRLGAGLVDIPPAPARDPETAIMSEPHVPEHRRFCGECHEPAGRSRDDVPGRTEGFCRKCGHPFSFTAKLARGELVAGQYEVAGCLAHGGLGWIYLARDRKVSDRWVVLKGLLNSTDEDAMAAALVERRFLAEVEHPNIVKIHNFAEHGGDGYIVMEFVNGTSLRGMLETRRADNGGQPDPLPVDQAIAYILEILPALGHLHDLGLLFCDFKPDNVIQTAGSVKLIDLGGVYRMDDRTSPVFGTVGYQAPEIAHTGPTVASDLFTAARTLAVLCTDFRGYQGTYRYTLPAQADVPLYTRFDSLYRFLERATAAEPCQRFQSADQMAAQLLGVLREIVAAETSSPAPGPSTRFTAEGRGSTAKLDWRTLPTPLVNADDPSSGLIVSMGAAEPDEIIELLRAAPDTSIEVQVWLTRALIEAGRLDEAAHVLSAVETADPGDWRTGWYRGIAALSVGAADEAARHMQSVYRALPGELAPKLALAYAAESALDHATAAHWYEIVSRTDPAFPSAAFGLARCRAALGDRSGAIVAFRRVPETSSAHVDAKVAEAGMLVGVGNPSTQVPDLVRAAAIVDALPLDREQRARLSAQVLEAALGLLQDGGAPDQGTVVVGCPLTERDLRLGLESTYRSLARHAATNGERISLVDRANQVRPRSLV